MSQSNSYDNYIITSACACNRGLRRANNEDNFYFDGEYMAVDNDGLDCILTCTREVSGSGDDDGCFFAVYDGMGGGQYGEVASYAAAAGTETFLDTHVPDDFQNTTEMLREMSIYLNEEVFKESSKRVVNQMGSTMVGCYFHAGRVCCCNVGDSKCTILRDGILEQISVDHNDAENMRLNGITGRKPYVTQFLGIDSREMTIRPALYEDKLRDGDIFVISSDGLTDMVEPDRITDILLEESDEEEKAQALLVEALKHGGRDNTTVIICIVRTEKDQ